MLGSGDHQKTTIWTLRKILLLIGLLASAAIVAAQFWSFEKYKNFSLDTLNKESTNQFRLMVQERIRQKYEPKLFTVGSDWARYKFLAKAMKDKKSPEEIATFDKWYRNNKEIQTGEIVLVATHFYTPEMDLITSSQKGSITDNAVILEELKARDKKAKRKPISFLWANSGGRPVHSTIFPVGGFKVAGFVELVTDPMQYLEGISETLGADVTIYDPSNSETGFAFSEKRPEIVSENETAVEEVQEGAKSPEVEPEIEAVKTEETGQPDTATPDITTTELKNGLKLVGSTAHITASLFGSHDILWARATLVRDVSDFAKGSEQLTQDAIKVLAGVFLATWLLAFLMLRFAVFGKLKAFAKAMTSISEGKVDIAPPVVGPDEFKTMATALDQLSNSVAQVFQLKNMVETSPMSTVMINTEGFISFANHRARRYINNENAERDPIGEDGNFFGLEQADFISLTDPENLPNTRLITYDDKLLEVSASAVVGNLGEFKACMLTWQNVTERENNREAASELINNVRLVADRVSALSSNVEETSTSLNSQSQTVTEQAQNTQQLAQGGYDSAQGVTQTTEAMSTDIRTINTESDHARTTSTEAINQLAKASETVTQLRSSSDSISKINEMITTITNQTKILAMNATIEAARAGEAGRGFGVVASEVKALAEETASATDQVAAMIKELQVHAQATTDTMESIDVVMQQVGETQNKISDSINEQDRAAGAIAQNIESMAQGSRQIVDLVNDVHRQSIDTGSSAQSLLGTSRELAEEAAKLNERLTEYQMHLDQER